MFKQTLVALCCLLALGTPPANAAPALVDVNRADALTLTGIKGIGPALASRIVAAREQDGPFRDAADLADRVRGLGPKSVSRLQREGLRIGAAAIPPQMPGRVNLMRWESSAAPRS